MNLGVEAVGITGLRRVSSLEEGVFDGASLT